MTEAGHAVPRILMLTQRFPYPPNRGDRIRAYNLLKFLVKHFDVSLACTSDEDVTDSQIDHLKQLCSQVCVARTYKLRRLANVATSFAAGHSLSEGFFGSVQLKRTITQWHAQQPFDVIVVFCSSMYQYADLPAFHSCRRVVDLVDVDSLKWEQMADSHRFPKKWLYAWEANRVRQLERRIVDSSSAIALVSPEEARLFSQRMGISASHNENQTDHQPSHLYPVVHGISNGVDTEYFAPAENFASRSDANIQLVFTGVLNYAPNVEGIIWFCRRVIPLLVDRFAKPFELKIVGRNPSKSILELQDLDNVRVIGEVPDVRPYLHSADIAISPLHLARGIQNKVLEAMAAGLPVVLTPQSAEGINANNDLHFMIAADEHQFADRLSMLMTSPQQRLGMGRAAREFVVDKFSWSSKLAQFKSVIQAAVR